MNASDQYDEPRPSGKTSKKPYTAPILSEYGGMTGLTQGELLTLLSAVATVTPLTVTLLDPG